MTRRRAWAIADVGTGSGCLAITLAHELPAARVTATDISPAALTVARDNAARLGVGDRVTFVQTSLLDAAPGPFDLIVANPPYVPASHRQTLSPDVRDHEPDARLYGSGADGLDQARALLAQAPSRLTTNGVLLMEFGFSQAEAVRDGATPGSGPGADRDPARSARPRADAGRPAAPQSRILAVIRNLQSAICNLQFSYPGGHPSCLPASRCRWM